jgi:hypothetical protein
LAQLHALFPHLEQAPGVGRVHGAEPSEVWQGSVSKTKLTCTCQSKGKLFAAGASAPQGLSRPLPEDAINNQQPPLRTAGRGAGTR